MTRWPEYDNAKAAEYARESDEAARRLRVREQRIEKLVRHGYDPDEARETVLLVEWAEK